MAAASVRFRSNSESNEGTTPSPSPKITLLHEIRERVRSQSVSASSATSPRETSPSSSSSSISSRLPPSGLSQADRERHRIDTTISEALQQEITRLMKKHKTLVTHVHDIKFGDRDSSSALKNEEIIKRLEKEVKSLEDQLSDKRAVQLRIYKELKRRELKRKACFNWTKAKLQSFSNSVRKYFFHPLRSDPNVGFLVITGPDVVESEKTYAGLIGARTVSTYPMFTAPGAHPIRQGDPICDRFNVHILENRVVFSVADGCNWGKRPMEAASAASASFMRYMRSVQTKLKTTTKCATYLIRAFAQAHDDIIGGKKDMFEVGTTTLIGGVICELDAENLSSDEDEPKGEASPKWGFLCASVGDCKAFHWSPKTKQVHDITSGNRTNPLNASDCGGRLGPYQEGGLPDLRNFAVFFKICDPDDIVMVMSDGVHDNLDPQLIGKKPHELGLSDSPTTAWAELPFEKIDEEKEKYRETVLREKILESLKLAGSENEDLNPNPEDIMRTVIKYCQDMTQSSRDFMENNPGKKLQDDYLRFPGKMDHTTFVAIRVGYLSKYMRRTTEASGAEEEEKASLEDATPLAPLTKSPSSSTPLILPPASPPPTKSSSSSKSMRKSLSMKLKGNKLERPDSK